VHSSGFDPQRETLLLLSAGNGRADTVETLLDEGKDGKLTVITCAFACVEVLKLKDHKDLSKEHEQMISDFFEHPFIKLVDATRGICEAAHRDFIIRTDLTSR